MDFNSYRKLPPNEKAQIWDDLEASPGWQVLKDATLAKIGAKPQVLDVNSREAFYFDAVKEAGMLDLLNYPDEMRRSASQRTEQKTS